MGQPRRVLHSLQLRVLRCTRSCKPWTAVYRNLHMSGLERSSQLTCMHQTSCCMRICRPCADLRRANGIPCQAHSCMQSNPDWQNTPLLQYIYDKEIDFISTGRIMHANHVAVNMPHEAENRKAGAPTLQSDHSGGTAWIILCTTSSC